MKCYTLWSIGSAKHACPCLRKLEL
jgi:hypothetical protein